MSRLDHVYRKLLLTKFFVKGWGQPENLKRIIEFRKILSDREKTKHLVSPSYPIFIDKDVAQKECRILEGHFRSPLVDLLPGIMPRESETAYFQMVLPNNWNTKHKPVCVHLAGTGDHYFWRRRSLLARPLLKESGIASIILENPYYGLRKPKQQLRSSLHNVSDLFVMGGALVLESLALFHWCERRGYGPLGITGISMGGFMASLAATNWHKPITLVPCLSWSTASSVFTQGVLSGAIPWKLLQEQFLTDRVYQEDVSKMIVSPEDMKHNKAFQLGRDFVKCYPESVDAMKVFQERYYNENKQSDIPDFNSDNTKSDSSRNATSTKAKSDTTSPHTVSSSAQYHTSSKSSNNSTSALNNLLSIFNKAPSLLNLVNALPSSDNQSLRKEALMFMRGVMDECTHLGNFTCPVDPSLIIIIAAERDAYVPRDSVLSLHDMWPGSELRYVDSGHISAFLFCQDVFRKAIADSFNKQIEKYHS